MTTATTTGVAPVKMYGTTGVEPYFYGIDLFNADGDLMGYLDIETGQAYKTDFEPWIVSSSGNGIEYPAIRDADRDQFVIQAIELDRESR